MTSKNLPATKGCPRSQVAPLERLQSPNLSSTASQCKKSLAQKYCRSARFLRQLARIRLSKPAQTTTNMILHDCQGASALVAHFATHRLLDDLANPKTGHEYEIFIGITSTQETCFLQMIDAIAELSSIAAKDAKGFRPHQAFCNNIWNLLGTLSVVNNFISTKGGSNCRVLIPKILEALETFRNVVTGVVLHMIDPEESQWHRQKSQRAKMNILAQMAGSLASPLEGILPPDFEMRFQESSLNGLRF